VDVTVIVPTYNRAEYLGACLESLLAQTAPAQQVLVVDDGSTDGTSEVIRSFGDSLESVRQENAGKATALNRGLADARGDGIWIFDDDDVALPDALAHLRGALEADAGAGFAFGGHESFSAPGEPLDPRAPRLDPSLDVDDLFDWILTRRAYVFQAGMLVRRRCYDEVGPFDPAFVRAQDFEMLTRLAARFPATRVDAVVFRQRQHAGDRGPAHQRIDGREVWDRQPDFDVQVARKVHQTMPVEVFVARRDRDTPSATPNALWRRSAAMLQWGLWDEAGVDLRALAARPAPPPSMVREVAPMFRAGAERLGLAGGEGAAVLADAASLPAGPVRDELLAVLLWPLTRQAAKGLLRGRPRSAESTALRTHARHVPAGALLRLTRVGFARVVEGLRRRVRRADGGPSV
jgi:glycosyltransferase involved in cell wall biosynthesis